jgi:hypothetical protein
MPAPYAACDRPFPQPHKTPRSVGQRLTLIPQWGTFHTVIRSPISVIELAGFRRRAGELLTPAELNAVIDLVAYEPTCGDLISGAGGLRKIRIGRKGMGKRGGATVIYCFHDVEIPIFLVAIYAKNEKGDLTPAEKKELAGLVKNFVTQWRKRK